MLGAITQTTAHPENKTMQGKKESTEGHAEGSLQPFREYSVAALSKLTDVPAGVLTKAIESRALAAVPGPGGRSGKWRVLGQSYFDWQKTRHGRTEPRPVYRAEALADAEARLKAARRVPGYTNPQQTLGGVAQPRGGVPQGEEDTPSK